MKRTLIIVLLLLAQSVFAHSITGVVVRVIDGDTVVLSCRSCESCLEKKFHKIRLAGIDAPEKKQAFGPQAKKALEAMVLGKVVVVTWKKKDRYRRIIGKLQLNRRQRRERSSVNAEMVALGYAWWYRKYSRSPALAKAEEHARTNKLGLWGDEAIAPWKFRGK